MQVSVGAIPGSGITSVALGSSATVNDALNAAGLNPDGFTVTVNGQPAAQNSVLNDGASVLLTKNAKGNK